jgi:manganese-dependent ADP-ribose/CDP-alcohol diphosphatase
MASLISFDAQEDTTTETTETTEITETTETTETTTATTKSNHIDYNNIILSFGAIADVQYANSENGADFKKTVVRRYRNSLKLLKAAIDEWTMQEKTVGYPIQMIVQLGDLLDGRCQETNKDRDICLQQILEQFNRMPSNVPRFDVIGNHELYNFTREELNDPNGPLHTSFSNDEILQKPSTFFSRVIVAGIRIINLDAYEISTLNGEKEPTTVDAYNFLSTKNPNNIRAKGVDWANGLVGERKRFVPYNGAISKEQLNWLRETLKISLERNERCIVLSHVSLQQGCCAESCVIWNYEEVVSCLHNPTGTGDTPVVACLYGHAHKGGYIMDDRGIHHLTLQSPLEAIGDEVAFATIDVTSNQLNVRGRGRVPSRVLWFPPISKPSATSSTTKEEDLTKEEEEHPSTKKKELTKVEEYISKV